MYSTVNGRMHSRTTSLHLIYRHLLTIYFVACDGPIMRVFCPVHACITWRCLSRDTVDEFGFTCSHNNMRRSKRADLPLCHDEQIIIFNTPVSLSVNAVALQLLHAGRGPRDL